MSYKPVTLGSISSHLTMLDVACRRCERKGRYNIARLIEKHGADMQMPEFRHVIAADCQRINSTNIYDLCGVHYPQLPLLPPHDIDLDDGRGRRRGRR